MNFEKYQLQTLQQQFENAKEIYEYYLSKQTNEGNLSPNSIWIMSDKRKRYYVGVIDYDEDSIKECTDDFAYYTLKVFDCYEADVDKECIGEIDFLAYIRGYPSTNFNHGYISSLNIEKEFTERGLAHSMLNQVMNFLTNDKGVKDNIEIIADGKHLNDISPLASYDEWTQHAKRLANMYSKHGMRVETEKYDGTWFEMRFDQSAKRRQSIPCEIENYTVHTSHYKDRTK